MKTYELSALVVGLGVQALAYCNGVQICAITDDSRRATPGCLFFAIATPRASGLDFVSQAIAQGAVAVVSSEEKPADLGVAWVQVTDVVTARLQIAQKFYDNPFAHLQCHGITGTNGKTTSVFVMEQVLIAAGFKVALLSTIVQRIGDQQQPSNLTTPGLLDLYAFAAQAVAAGCEHLVMEVSSHALDQERIAGLGFKSVLFSNLSQDHLDYHGDMETYFTAKARLFTQYAYDFAVVNVDDAWGPRIAKLVSPAQLVTVGRQVGDFVPQSVAVSPSGIVLELPQLAAEPICAQMMGEFNADNLLLVGAWAWALKLPGRSVVSALQQAQVPGRMQLVFNRAQRRVFVDYAHTPAALERVLQTVRAICSGQVHLVFGCGGNRDRGKRPLMGRIAQECADVCWITSDNPRTEDPEAIIAEILQGMADAASAHVIPDRRAAINQACAALQPNDCLVVAGKGHEDYQIIGTTKHPFADVQVVGEAMA